ncbi:MAG: hypothetical protein NC226_10365 [Bacteroides cellulosilyticus]|nr:hypothetical protein [Bacteroides cellulosilyticus]
MTVSPDTLFYDLSGNPLDAGAFTVKTNCAWSLSVPEPADWFEASATSGSCDASVSFQLDIDPHYRVAELMFSAIAADGKPIITRSVVIQQGEKPAGPSNPDNPTDPDTPDNPDKNPDSDPSGPSDPGDNTDPSDPDNPDNPGKDPEIPPVTPAIPKIESVNPTALVWAATESGVSREVFVTVKDFDSYVLSEPKISGVDADRFKASANGLKVFVETIGPNETDADYRATLEISVAGGNSTTVSLLQSKRESVPDNGDSGSSGTGGDSGDNSGSGSGDNSGGGSGEENGEPELPQGGGHDDFSMLAPSVQLDKKTTQSGWTGSYCAVYSGDNGNDTAPFFRSLLGGDSNVRGLAMHNDPAKAGRIESPELHGGCGNLTFRYGVTEPNKSVDFMVEIVRNGTVVKSWQVRKAVKQYESNVFSANVQFAGDFRIVIRNNPSSNGAEYTTIFQIAWSGYSGN